MALSADFNYVEQEGKLLALPVVAADIIYKGSLCKINAAGFLAPCAPEAGSTFAGIAIENIDNSAGAAGDLLCRVQNVGAIELVGAGLAQSDVGSKVYATDDGVITTVEGTTSKQLVGVIVKFISATSVLVKLTPFSGTGASA
jgi:hypothetical protein